MIRADGERIATATAHLLRVEWTAGSSSTCRGRCRPAVLHRVRRESNLTLSYTYGWRDSRGPARMASAVSCIMPDVCMITNDSIFADVEHLNKS